MMAPEDDRRASLVGALGLVRSRIADACAPLRRDPRSVTLVAVTKTYPASDVAALAALGQLDFGESRDQEARLKIAELAELAAQAELAAHAAQTAQAAPPLPPTPLRWHVVGRLQTNKARSVAGYAEAVHSVDRIELAVALADAAERIDRDRPLDVFAQVSLDGDPARGGVPADGLAAVADAVAGRAALRLRGVMAVAPLGADPDAAFAMLAEVAQRLRTDHPAADAISAGMSADLEQAVRHGATHVRVGSALLGRTTGVLG